MSTGNHIWQIDVICLLLLLSLLCVKEQHDGNVIIIIIRRNFFTVCFPFLSMISLSSYIKRKWKYIISRLELFMEE